MDNPGNPVLSLRTSAPASLKIRHALVENEENGGDALSVIYANYAAFVFYISGAQGLG